MTASLRLLVADDHPIVLGGLEKLLSVRADFHIVASVTNGGTAWEQICRLEPDVALLDINMPQLSGLDVLERVEAQGLSTRVVLLTASTADAQLKRAATAGAWGIVIKDAAADVLLQCIDTVARGKRWLPKDFLAPAIQREEERERSLAKLENQLTTREQQIAQLVSQGLSNKHVAKRMCISEGTVKIHLHNIYSKLGVSNRTSLAMLLQKTLNER